MLVKEGDLYKEGGEGDEEMVKNYFEYGFIRVKSVIGGEEKEVCKKGGKRDENGEELALSTIF